MRDFVSACTEALESEDAEAALAEKELWRAETEEYERSKSGWISRLGCGWMSILGFGWWSICIYLNMFSTITRAKEHTWS